MPERTSLLPLVLALALAWPAGVHASSFRELSWEDFRGPTPKPGRTVLTGFYSVQSGKMKSAIRLEYLVETGGVTFLMAADGVRGRYRVNADLTPVDLQTDISSPDSIAFIGYDARKALLKEGMRLEWSLWKGGAVTKRSEVSLARPMVNSDTLGLCLQRLLLLRPESRSGELFLMSMGMRLGVDFRYFTATNLGEISKYRLPPEAASRTSALTKTLHVYEMSANGLIGFFASDKYYQVFRDDAEKTPVAYWGGGEKAFEFMIIDSIERKPAVP